MRRAQTPRLAQTEALTEQRALITPLLLQRRLFTCHTRSLMRGVFSTYVRKTESTVRTPEYTLLETKNMFTAGVHNFILFFFLSGIRHQTSALLLIVLPADDTKTAVTDTYYYRYKKIYLIL